MLTPLKSEVQKVGDLSHEARRFRTILWTFEKNVELLFKGTGLAAEVDHEALAEAFSRWRQAFDQSKHLADINRQDFVIFAAGMMLKELLAARPITAIVPSDLGLPAIPDTLDHRLKRWPEGYAYTSFCLSVATAVLHETGDVEPRESGVACGPSTTTASLNPRIVRASSRSRWRTFSRECAELSVDAAAAICRKRWAFCFSLSNNDSIRRRFARMAVTSRRARTVPMRWSKRSTRGAARSSMSR